MTNVVSTEEETPESRMDEEFLPAPTPANLPLRNADDVRVEMAKVYREMRGGRVDINIGAKLAWVLTQINKVIETSVIEKRIEAVERVLKVKP